VIPVPVEEVEVEHDGTEYESRLQEETLCILLLSREQDHLGRPDLSTRQVLDVLQKLHLVRLHKCSHTQETMAIVMWHKQFLKAQTRRDLEFWVFWVRLKFFLKKAQRAGLWGFHEL